MVHIVLIIVRLPEGNKNNQYTSLSTRPKQLKNVFSNRWWIENANQINVIRVVALLHCKSISYFRYAWCIQCHVDFDCKCMLLQSKEYLIFTQMLLACHKKSYLIRVKFSKYYVIFILIFFSMYKTETANRAETAAWK